MRKFAIYCALSLAIAAYCTDSASHITLDTDCNDERICQRRE